MYVNQFLIRGGSPVFPAWPWLKGGVLVVPIDASQTYPRKRIIIL